MTTFLKVYLLKNLNEVSCNHCKTQNSELDFITFILFFSFVLHPPFYELILVSLYAIILCCSLAYDVSLRILSGYEIV